MQLLLPKCSTVSLLLTQIKIILVKGLNLCWPKIWSFFNVLLSLLFYANYALTESLVSCKSCSVSAWVCSSLHISWITLCVLDTYQQTWCEISSRLLYCLLSLLCHYRIHKSERLATQKNTSVCGFGESVEDIMSASI